MKRLWPFGSRAEQPEDETDRATREARIEHETRMEQRRAQADLLRDEVAEMPEVAVLLEPGRFSFASIYTAPSVVGLPEGMKPQYGLTIPAETVLEAYADPDWKRLLLTYASFKPATYGRSNMPWDYARLSNRIRPEVYTIDRQTMENQPSDLDWLITELARLKVRNRPEDHVFEGRKLKVHFRPFAYWTGSLHHDRSGIGLSLKRVGVHTGRGL